MKKILLICCLILTACLPQSVNGEDGLEIVEGEIGGQKYYVPEVYFNPMGNKFLDDDIALQAYYPSFEPLPETTEKIWKKGELWKNIRILVKYYPKSTLDTEQLVQNQIDFLKAFEVVGEEYGLIHQKQPKEYAQDDRDVWVEKQDGQNISIITCTERHSEISVPQCTQHYYIRPKLHIKIEYDKKILRDWRLIDSNVRALFKSFDSLESAQEFLHQKVQPYQTQGSKQ